MFFTQFYYVLMVCIICEQIQHVHRSYSYNDLSVLIAVFFRMLLVRSLSYMWVPRSLQRLKSQRPSFTGSPGLLGALSASMIDCKFNTLCYQLLSAEHMYGLSLASYPGQVGQKKWPGIYCSRTCEVPWVIWPILVYLQEGLSTGLLSNIWVFLNHLNGVSLYLLFRGNQYFKGEDSMP